MKNIVKRTNPAFKLRQTLPLVTGTSARSGSAAPNAAAARPLAAMRPARPAAAPTWVTTE